MGRRAYLLIFFLAFVLAFLVRKGVLPSFVGIALIFFGSCLILAALAAAFHPPLWDLYLKLRARITTVISAEERPSSFSDLPDPESAATPAKRQESSFPNPESATTPAKRQESSFPNPESAATPAKRQESSFPNPESAAIPAKRQESSFVGEKAGDLRALEINGVSYRFRWCPAGSFMMGSPKEEDNRFDDEVQHEVVLTRGFWMLETQVTQAMWRSVMGYNPSDFSNTGGGKSKVSGLNTDNFPVENVSWDDCQEFINKLNAIAELKGLEFRLPTEAQWEYACRAGTTTPFFWGSSLNGDKANCFGYFPYGTDVKGEYLGRTSPVGSYSANPWGFFDMHGNVYEWCADWYDDYPTGTVTDPLGPAVGSYRVLRGGSWYFFAQGCRSAYRGCNVVGYRYSSLGFRLSLVPNK